MIRAFSNLVERTGDQDAATAVWLIRVTNPTALPLLFSSLVTVSTLPPLFPRAATISLNVTCENEGLNLAERIRRSSRPIRILSLLHFGYVGPPDFYDDDDDLFVRGRDFERAVTITMTTATATNGSVRVRTTNSD